MKQVLGLFLLTIFLASCSTQTFIVSPGGASAAVPTLEESQPFFVGGVGQDAVVDAAAICGGAANIARIETEQAPLDVALSYLTGSIYSPRTARVFCL